MDNEVAAKVALLAVRIGAGALIMFGSIMIGALGKIGATVWLKTKGHMVPISIKTVTLITVNKSAVNWLVTLFVAGIGFKLAYDFIRNAIGITLPGYAW